MREGFPNVVLEAAGMEKPAIVSDATGAVDSVVDGVTGRVFGTGDVEALVTVLRETSKSEMVARMGRNARSLAESAFSRDRIWRLQSDYLAERVRESEPS
jgi:glycosyltransferase involved in cell wall biosynthesis